MAVSKNSNRQLAIVAYQDVALADLVGPTLSESVVVNAADLTSASDFTTALALPVGAVVVGGAVYVDEAFDSGTSDTLTVGDGSSDSRYLSGADLQSVAPKALVPTGFIVTSGEPVAVVKWTKVGAAPTKGRFRLQVDYYVVADVVTKTVNLTYDQLTSGTGFNAIALPAGAVVIGGHVDVVTPFNSVTSDVIVVGDASSANRYVASTTVHTGASTPIAFVPTGFVATASEPNLQVKWTQVGGSTSAGALAVTVSYYVAKDVAVIELPHDAVLMDGALTVSTAFNSGTSDTMSLGDASSSARYLGQTSVASTGRNAITPTGYDNPSHSELTLRWIRLGSTAPTAGVVRVMAKYYRNERASFSQE